MPDEPLSQAKSGVCTPANECVVSSIDFVVDGGGMGLYSQCNVDQDCPTYASDESFYLLPTSPPGAARTADNAKWCCHDMEAFAALYCDGVSPANLAAWSSPMCKQWPSCIAQDIYSPKAALPKFTCYVGTSKSKDLLPLQYLIGCALDYSCTSLLIPC